MNDEEESHWKHTKLAGGNSNIFGIFTPKIGEIIQFDEHIFQMGWFNHQLENHKRVLEEIIGPKKTMILQVKMPAFLKHLFFH